MVKRFTPYLLSLTVFILAFQSSGNYVHSNNSGAPAGNTGSPFDNKTCARSGCHATSAAQPSAVQIISSNVPVTGYVPGSTYTFTATCTSTNGGNEFGFEISPMSNTGALLGTLIVTNTAHTKIVSSKYITHTTAGTAGTAGSKTWTFDWVAPVAGTGDVTFYGAFNYANSNNFATGDLIRTNTLTVSEDLTVGINEITRIASTVYPNPVTDRATLEFELRSAALVKLRILDAAGRIVLDNIEFDGVTGKQSARLDIPSDWPSGVYKICLEAGKQQSVKNFIKL